MREEPLRLSLSSVKVCHACVAMATNYLRIAVPMRMIKKALAQLFLNNVESTENRDQRRNRTHDYRLRCK